MFQLHSNVTGRLEFTANSHGNSGKVHTNQPIVIDAIMSQYDNGERLIGGVMIESNLKEGNQKLKDPKDLEYGLSITDSCVNLQTTSLMLERIARSVMTRNISKRKAPYDRSNEEGWMERIRC